MSMQSLLAYHIRKHGPIPTVRVSSAQAACDYAYWGAVRYEIRLTRAGLPSNRPLERARSDRRSKAGARRDAARLADREGRRPCQRIGLLPEKDCRDYLPAEYADAIRRHDERRGRRAAAPVDALGLPVEVRLLARLYSRASGVSPDRSLLMARARRLVRDGRWIIDMSGDLYYYPRGVQYYLPHGDDRDAAEFEAEANQERRRKILAACGERVLPPERRAMAQMDDYGQLWEITRYDVDAWNHERTERQVRVVCPSTGAVYWLPVPRHVTTAREAVASTFGLTAAEYVLAAES